MSCLAALSVLCMTFACGGGSSGDASDTIPVSHGTFTLMSDIDVDSAELPSDYTCDGRGISPALSWSDAPAGTKEFALLMSTITVDNDIKYNWVLYHIPAASTGLAENSSGVGTTGAGSHGASLAYEPPCSQGPGSKLYTFTLYALSGIPQVPAEADQVTGEVLAGAISSITLGSATLDLSYTRP